MYIQGQFPWHKLASDGDKKISGFKLRVVCMYMYNTYFFEHRKEKKIFQLHSSQVKTRAEMKWIRRFWIDWETGLRPGPLTNLSGFGNKSVLSPVSRPRLSKRSQTDSGFIVKWFFAVLWDQVPPSFHPCLSWALGCWLHAAGDESRSQCRVC